MLSTACQDFLEILPSYSWPSCPTAPDGMVPQVQPTPFLPGWRPCCLVLGPGQGDGVHGHGRGAGTGRKDRSCLVAWQRSGGAEATEVVLPLLLLACNGRAAHPARQGSSWQTARFSLPTLSMRCSQQKGCACIGYLLSAGKGPKRPRQRASDLILLAAQVISTDKPKTVCPCSGTQPLRGGVVPSPPQTDIPLLQLQAEQPSGVCFPCRLVSALCRVCAGDDDSFGSSVDGPVCSSHDSLLPYI